MTFKYDDGVTPDKAVRVIVGGRGWEGYSAAGVTRPSREGYRFDGWYAGDTMVISTSSEAAMDTGWEAGWVKDMILTAKWTVRSVNILLTWDEDASPHLDVIPYNAKEGDTLWKPTGDAAAGFKGWYDEDAERFITDAEGALLADFAELYPSYRGSLTLIAWYE